MELEKSLRSDTWIQNLSPYTDLENIVKADFAKQDKKWREGNAKTSFTYLLLDPRVTANLPAKGQQNPYMSWSTFINSIFYVGKGKWYLLLYLLSLFFIHNVVSTKKYIVVYIY